MCLVLYFVPFINWLICFALYLYLLLTDSYALLYIYTFDLNFALYFYLWTESCNLLFMYTFELQILYFALFVYLWTGSCTLLFLYIFELNHVLCSIFIFEPKKPNHMHALLYIYTIEPNHLICFIFILLSRHEHMTICRIWQLVGFGNMSDLAICRI